MNSILSNPRPTVTSAEMIVYVRITQGAHRARGFWYPGRPGLGLRRCKVKERPGRFRCSLCVVDHTLRNGRGLSRGLYNSLHRFTWGASQITNAQATPQTGEIRNSEVGPGQQDFWKLPRWLSHTFKYEDQDGRGLRNRAVLLRLQWACRSPGSLWKCRFGSSRAGDREPGILHFWQIPRWRCWCMDRILQRMERRRASPDLPR